MPRWKNCAQRYDPTGMWALISAETYLYALRDPRFAARYRAYHQLTLQTFVKIVEGVFQRARRIPPMPLEDLCDAFLALNRSLRLPVAENESFRQMPPSLLITMLRGMLAIAAKVDEAPPAAALQSPKSSNSPAP